MHWQRIALQTSAAAIAFAVLAGCDSTQGQEATVSEEQTPEDRPAIATERGKALLDGASAAIEAAILKAEELEYKLQELSLELEETEDGGWRVQFNPKSKIQRGGNLTVHVSQSGEITQVQRWR
jgi:hypothetical protein